MQDIVSIHSGKLMALQADEHGSRQLLKDGVVAACNDR
jgi:hypothetical protein